MILLYGIVFGFKFLFYVNSRLYSFFVKLQIHDAKIKLFYETALSFIDKF